MTKIYLVENINGDSNTVYIGKTVNPKVRKSGHRKVFGSDIVFTVIDEINSIQKKDWKPLESYWILQFRTWGFNVVNKNNGGGGPSYQTEESNKKRSESNKGKNSGSKNGMWGKSGELHPMFGKQSRSRGIKRPDNTIRMTGDLNPMKNREVVRKNKEKVEKKVLRLNKDTLEVEKEYRSISEASREMKISVANISGCCNNNGYKTAGGFKWKFKIVE